MSIYDHKQVLTDYARSHITPEMAIGHSLQHINNLYEAQTTARNQWHAELDALKKQLQLVQTTVERLNGIIEKARAKQKTHTSHNPNEIQQA